MTFGHSGGEGGGGQALGCQWGGGCYAQEKVLPVPSSPRAIIQLSALRKSSETAYLLALVKPILPQCNKLVGWEGGVGVGGGGGGAVIKVNWRRQSVTRQCCWEMSVVGKDNPAALRCTPIASSLMKMSGVPQVTTRDGPVVTATQVRLLKSGEAEVNSFPLH